MRVVKIRKRGSHEGNETFAYSHCFSVRIKSGLLSHTDARVAVHTDRTDVSVDEVVNAIESQDRSIMREIIHALRSRHALIAAYLGRHSFTARIGDDDCRLYFNRYEPADYLISHPGNWEAYRPR